MDSIEETKMAPTYNSVMSALEFVSKNIKFWIIIVLCLLSYKIWNHPSETRDNKIYMIILLQSVVVYNILYLSGRLG